MINDTDVYIGAVARTAFGRFGGKLKDIAGPELGALAIDETISRSGVDAQAIEAVYAGVGMIGSAVLTPARRAVLRSRKLKDSTPSLTVDRACCSGLTAISLGWKDIRLGLADAVLCGGFENLSQTPFLWPRQRGAKPGAVDINDPLLLRAEFLDKAIAAYTGEEAMRLGITRADQDQWALKSHEKYFKAQAQDYFDFECFPLISNDAPFEADESPRSDTSLAKLASLKPVYGSPTVTPGNAPGLSDGAAFVLLLSGRFARAHGVTPLARIIGYTQVASGPTTGSYTPGIAIAELLRRTNVGLDDIRQFEINEAFAATPLASTLHLALGDRGKVEKLREHTNPYGGAVAIGHPLGASGARLAMTIANGLRRNGGGIGAAAICGGYGQGDALLLAVE
ncbi:thiolase family protein [Taklimakanibacter deserti]|uniref:thiolase family protein n=1 Tax=Taklimakanibacter deserti TaxID=2267839 RepID=UPI000E651560